MILPCPSCGAKFQIDPDLVGPDGRMVRCGSCGHTWRQHRPNEESPEPSASQSATPEPAVSESPPPAETSAPTLTADRPDALSELNELDAARRRSRAAKSMPRPPERRLSVLIGWLVLLLLVSLVGLGGYFGREQIVSAVPQAERLYAGLGLPSVQPGEGLELRISPERKIIDGEARLIIKGQVENVSQEPREVPPLQATLTDPSGRQIDRWEFPSPVANLAPGGSAAFETSTRDPRDEIIVHVGFLVEN